MNKDTKEEKICKNCVHFYLYSRQSYCDAWSTESDDCNCNEDESCSRWKGMPEKAVIDNRLPEEIIYQNMVDNTFNISEDVRDIIKNALVKQIPRKYLLRNESAYCPGCGELLLEADLMPHAPDDDDAYCGYCGQKIDWVDNGEENELQV